MIGQTNKKTLKQRFYIYRLFQKFETLDVFQRIVKGIKIWSQTLILPNVINLWNLNYEFCKFEITQCVTSGSKDIEILKIKLVSKTEPFLGNLASDNFIRLGLNQPINTWQLN